MQFSEIMAVYESRIKELQSREAHLVSVIEAKTNALAETDQYEKVLKFATHHHLDFLHGIAKHSPQRMTSVPSCAPYYGYFVSPPKWNISLLSQDSERRIGECHQLLDVRSAELKQLTLDKSRADALVQEYAPRAVLTTVI